MTAPIFFNGANYYSEPSGKQFICTLFITSDGNSSFKNLISAQIIFLTYSLVKHKLLHANDYLIKTAYRNLQGLKILSVLSSFAFEIQYKALVHSKQNDLGKA